MPHSRVQLEMFVYKLAEMFCSEFSPFCCEVLLCLFSFLQLAELLCCREPCFLIIWWATQPSCAC